MASTIAAVSSPIPDKNPSGQSLRSPN
ncbi:hypothetical protein CURTO8I2_220214 [Curtobacterium sp. 8I-2]|nr:hypothetical protein CURTO8I2_220214 [Curtobacterium sp. 8I-2]